MSKPILWLGPLEELDADFDPLLGRSARSAQPQSYTTPPPVARDPSRSVFDDPLPEVLPQQLSVPLQDATQDAPQSPTQDPMNWGTSAPAVVPSFARPFETQPTIDEIVAPANVAPERVTDAPVEATDFTHNNDPIPVRQGVGPSEAETARQVPKLEVSPAAPTVPPIPKRTFFASLFGQREITPDETSDTSTDGDIEAKPAPQSEALSGPDLTSEPDGVPADEIAPDVAATSLRGRNIWTEISEEPEAPPTEHDARVAPSPASGATEGHAGEPIIDGEIEGENNSLTDTRDTAPVTDVKVSQDLDDPAADVAQVEAAAPEQGMQAPETEPTDTQEPEELAVDVSEPVETASEPEIQLPQDVQAAPPTTIDFQSAFNADRFWAWPAGTNPPHSEPDAEIESEPSSNVPESDVPATGDVEVRPFEAEPIVAPTPTAPKQEVPLVAAVAPAVRTGAPGKRRKKKSKKTYVGAFFGTFLFGIAALMTVVSSLAAFGYPFDLMSSYRWYWIIMSVAAAGIWGLSRGWKMVIASFAVMGANLFVTVPASGKAPSGGKTATAVIGWANVAGNSDALTRVFKDADKKKATLLMLAEAPQGVFTPPAGWSLIEAPVTGDPTAIAVLSKSTWRAATVPGEPTMARPPAGDLTVIGVHPQDAVKTRRRTPNRDALINRAGTRAGIQDGPTIVLGDFNAAPWDSAMNQFRNYGNVTRVRCGGWAGTTLTQAFGLIGVATDHAYVRDVKVTHCQLGSSLTGGNHKPIWLYVAPQPAPPSPQVQP